MSHIPSLPNYEAYIHAIVCIAPSRAAVIKWETSIQMRRDRLLEVAQEYGRNIVNCSGTLTKEERAGLESLQKRIKDNELVVVETDKSGTFSVMRQD